MNQPGEQPDSPDDGRDAQSDLHRDLADLGLASGEPAMTRAQARAAAAARLDGSRADATSVLSETRTRPTRRRASVTGVLGEVLLTLGAVALLFVAWQMWFSGWIGGASNNAAGRTLEQQWERKAGAMPASEQPSGSPGSAGTPTGGQPAPGDPPVLAEAADGQTFGVMYIPRFGAEYSVPVGGGVSRARTLDTIGIGHYPDTAMPGGVGNSAYAAHRTGYGGWPFYRIAELRPGDQIIVATQDGWYTYVYRNFEYVTPSGTRVLDDVPQSTHAPSNARYLTLTSCSPVHTTQERIVAYALYESFTPRANGAPASIASLVPTTGG